MKNFDDMGLIEMAKTLGEMGDDFRKEYHHTATDCVKAEDAYEKEINRLRTQNEDLLDIIKNYSSLADAIVNGDGLDVDGELLLERTLCRAQFAIFKAEGRI